MAGEPPDLIVAPRLAHLRLLDFHRAKEAIEEGRRAVSASRTTLLELNMKHRESDGVVKTTRDPTVIVGRLDRRRWPD